MEIKLGVSNRHVHLTKEDFNKLFEKDDEIKNLEMEYPLVQPHQYASTSYVDLKTEKDILHHVRVLGPLRNYTQAEISKTDARFLGINPPVRDSGDLENAEKIEIIGPYGSITKNCAIIATRHIHVTEQMKKDLELEDYDEVSVEFKGEKSVVFNNVKLKVCEEANFELHLDTDDANGSLLQTGDIGIIITKQQNY